MNQKIIILMEVKLSVSNKTNMQRICSTTDPCEEMCGIQPRACEALEQNGRLGVLSPDKPVWSCNVWC